MKLKQFLIKNYDKIIIITILLVSILMLCSCVSGEKKDLMDCESKLLNIY